MRRSWRPWDLLVVLVGTAIAGAAMVTPGVPQELQWVLAVPLLGLFPGAALVAALLPASGPDADRPGPAVLVGLAVAASALVVGVVGAGLAAAGALTLTSAVVALVGTVLVGTVVASLRRSRVEEPADRPGVRERVGLSTVQIAVLVVAGLALVAAIGVGATATPEASYSEVALLDADQQLLGPGPLAVGNATTLTLRLDNTGGAPVTYRVVGQRQRVGPDGPVGEPRRIDQFTVQVPAGGHVLAPRSIDPPPERARLQYLVYTGPVPETPRPANAELVVRQSIEAADG